MPTGVYHSGNIDPESIARGLRWNRKNIGASQKAVAAQTGLSVDTIQRYEMLKEHDRVQLPTVRRLCAYYNKSITDIIRDGNAHRGYAYDVLHNNVRKREG